MRAVMETVMLGRPFSFWLELQRRFEQDSEWPRKERLLEEVLALRAKVALYESRVKDMHDTMVKS